MRDYYISLRSRNPVKKKPVCKGDLILSSEPFAHIINNHHLSEYCDYCFVSQEKKLIKPCKGCRVPWYCSEDCARLGWDIHQYECHRLQRLANNVPPAFVRLLARIMFRLQNGGDKIVEKYNEKEGRRFRDLMNHYADVKNDKKSQDDVESLMSQLGKYIGKQNLPNESDFFGIYGRMRISYIDPVASVASRLEDLHNKWYFWCDCKTCADKERANMESSILCGNCSTPVYIPEAYSHKIPSIECPKCQELVDKEKIRLYRQIVIFTKYHLNRMSEESPNLTDCLEILERQGDELHPLNVWRVRTLDFAFNAAVHNGCWALALDYGDKNYEGMRYYYGENNPTFALFLFKYGKAKIYLKDFYEGVKLLDKAEPILKAGLGSTHPVVVDQLIPTNLLANEDINICLQRRMAIINKQEARKGKPVSQAA
ncbi:histone-lysine N-methyltransferase SMYD3-like isoform X2 [Macrobrachium rosenbergii]|uniref:histone-lysine N-methyltransferase SMYD3-like isoform X2 n=1 Tax=Macrobrachium rosenbergii TaxID=79674 RepID=UPI0034D7057B